MGTTSLAATTDAMANAVADRVRRATTTLAPVSLMVIGDDGVEERHLTATGDLTDGPGPGAVEVRFEFMEDVAALLAGDLGLPGLAYCLRAEVAGDPRAVNAVAPCIALSEHRFVPYVSRSAVLTDAELQELLDEEGIPSLLRRMVEANAYAYTLIDLASHIGEFRTRWSVGGHQIDSVSGPDGISVVDLDPDAEVGCLVTYEPLAWMRWLGTTCAPPAREGEEGNELTFIDGLLSGRFSMVGNTHSLEAVARLMPHCR